MSLNQSNGQGQGQDAVEVGPRAQVLFRRHQQRILRRTDRLFAGLLAFEWAAAVFLAAWTGHRPEIAASHPLRLAFELGGWFVGIPVLLALTQPGRVYTRHIIAVAQMLMSALLIHLSGGRLETHFHVFGSLAFLAFYRDWRVLVTASAVAAADHVLRGLYWPMSIYGVASASPWRGVVHTAWIIFEDLFLIPSCIQGVWEMWETAERQAELEATRARIEQTVQERTAELRAQAETLTGLTERLQESEAEAQKLALVASRTDNAVVITDAGGRVEWINEGFTRVTGYTLEEVVGRTPGSFLQGAGSDPITLGFMGERIRRGEGFNVELVNYNKSGREFWMAIGVQPIRDACGTLTNFIGVNRDITARRREQEELRKAMEAAEAASRAKSEFLANVSHEIRTPMNGIIGMTELALDTELSREQREYLELVKVSADSLLSVINDILDFSKIEAGKLQLDPVPFDLRDAIGETMKTLGLRAHQKGLELAHHVPADVPDALVGDLLRLRQILVNLVGNAIKFTERGEVVTRVEVESVAGRHALLHFAVTDTGIGIPAGKLQAIFAPFEQVDGSTTRQYGGTGLGLAISTRLVKMMGGKIWVDSEVGQGSTFHFTARFEVAEAPAPRTPAGSAVELRGLPVLVVDDNATNRRILKEILAHWRMEPFLVESGREALQRMRQAADEGKPFPLVLSDAMMPEMDGFTLVEEIKRDSRLAGAVIMMLSSADQPTDAARCRSLGVANYLTKPIKQSDLLDAIARVLRSAATGGPDGPGAAAIGAVPATAAASTPASAPAPSPARRVLLAEDNPVNQTLAVRLLERRGHSVTVAGDGRQALEALEAGSFDVVLMDVQMPNLGGIEATALIRQGERGTGRHLPVIAMTARAMKGDREECLRSGFDDYLAKPLRPQELYDLVDRWTATGADETTPAFDKEALLELVDHDEELLQEVVALFLEQSAGLLAEVREAIAEGDPARVNSTAHSLKGAMSHFSALAAHRAALRLEEMGRSGDLSGAGDVYRSLEPEVIRLKLALGSLLKPVLAHSS